MQIIKYILVAIYIINCLALVIITMMQSKEEEGPSAVLGGSKTDNFYEKNKGRTREGKTKRWTIILATSFAVLTILLGIVYVIK